MMVLSTWLMVVMRKDGRSKVCIRVCVIKWMGFAVQLPFVEMIVR